MTTRDLGEYNTYSSQSRIRIEDDEEFVQDIILDRDASEYPDPYFVPVDDVELLNKYINRVETAVQNYSPTDEAETETIREYVEMERSRVHARRAQLLFPDPEEYGVSREFIRNMEHSTAIPAVRFSDLETDWDVWMDVFELDVDTLRFLSAYFRVHSNIEQDDLPSEVSIIDGFRFVKGDETVSIEELFTWVDVDTWLENHSVQDEDGNEVEVTEGYNMGRIKERLHELTFGTDSFLFGLAFGQVREVTNVSWEGGSDGRYINRKIRVSSESVTDENGEKDESAIMEREVIGHEFFHAVQDVIGTIDPHMDYVDMDAEPSEWEPITFFDEPEESPVYDIQQDMKAEWFRFRAGEYDSLCDYQTRNIHEMFAVGFECFVTAPETLEAEQPRVYDIINRVVSL